MESHIPERMHAAYEGAQGCKRAGMCVGTRAPVRTHASTHVCVDLHTCVCPAGTPPASSGGGCLS